MTVKRSSTLKRAVRWFFDNIDGIVFATLAGMLMLAILGLYVGAALYAPWWQKAVFFGPPIVMVALWFLDRWSQS